MDYDWKYYMDDIKEGRSRIGITGDDRMAAGRIRKRMDLERREAGKSRIRTMLRDYRHNGEAENALIDDVMRRHTEYCRLLPDDALLKRRHNAVVYRYVIKTPLTNRAVAGRLQIERTTLANDIWRTVDDFMVILYGVPALPDVRGSWPEYVKALFENMRLLPYCREISGCFGCAEWERERVECVELTEKVLSCAEKAMQMYGEYCESCIFPPEAARRAHDIVRALYFGGGGRDIADIALEQGVSWQTAYSDVGVAIGRFAELFEYMATGI